MKKILSCLLAACFGMALLSSCANKTQVAKAAADVEAIAADINEVVESFPENADMTDPNTVKKIQNLSDQSNELMESVKQLGAKYSFVSINEFGGIAVNEEELAKLSEAEKADAQQLRDAVKHVQDAYVSLIDKSAKSIQNTLEEVDNSGLDPAMMMPDPSADLGDEDSGL